MLSLTNGAYQSLLLKIGKKALDKVSGASTGSAMVVIPVIFHIVHAGQVQGVYPNISAAQISSQIVVLNEDYSGIGHNTVSYPVNAFSNFVLSQSLAPASVDGFKRLKIANCNIGFCLATKDTLGNILAEPGIDRVNSLAKGWRDPAGIVSITDFYSFMEDTVKPQSIWNVSRYLNIWITDKSSTVGFTGYGTFPLLSGLPDYAGGATAFTDGIWCFAKAVGSSVLFPGGTYQANKAHGRTCSHEVGHYLGLRHVWGDALCGNDYAADTPPSTASHTFQPSYPYNAGSCPGNGIDGELFMNIMDYTPDAGRYMFTAEQAARMHVSLQNSPYRKFLGTHNLCTLDTIPSISQFTTPASCCTNSLSALLINGSRGVPAPSYSWIASATATFIPGANSRDVKVIFASAGIHTISLSTSNGSISVSSRTILVNASPQLSFTPGPGTICAGNNITIHANGASSYSWLPGGQTGSSFIFSPSTNTTISVIASSIEGCITYDSLTFKVNLCEGIQEVGTEASLIFYPNPVAGHLYFGSVAENYTSVDCFNNDGHQVITNRRIPDAAAEIEILPPGVYYILFYSERNAKVRQKIIKLPE
jgi:hypothetical protein